MIFGEFPCEEAAGLMLAHTLKVGGKTLKKGHVLTAADLAWLRQVGVAHVLGARMEAADVAEDPAAAEVAGLLAGVDSHVAVTSAHTGRCNLQATVGGLLRVNAERLDRLNLIDEAVAIATLPQHTLVRPGQVIATVKIIPFAVPRRLIDACRDVAVEGAALRVAPLRAARAALIMSALPGMKESIFAGTVAATRHRLEAAGSRLALVMRCAHDQRSLTAMLDQALAAGCDLLLVSGATVAKDRHDIAPAAVVAAGGVIEHFGMPVEPGNMLVLAQLGRVPVIILPGCGRSRRTNGLDWVLQRVLAGLTPTREDIMRMGVGGLIRNATAFSTEAEHEADNAEGSAEDNAENPDHDGHTGRRKVGAAGGATGRAQPVAHGSQVGALVLAAGRSSRMGADNKLLMPVGGVPMVLRAVNAARASRATSVTVVVGHQAAAVEALLAGGEASVVRNPDYAQGMSTSLRHGIAALPGDVAAVLVLLGDMPRISADHLDRLIAAFDPERPMIVVPERDGRRGNPMLWPREFFAAMSSIEGDQGARGLLEQHCDRVTWVPIDDDAIFLDVDRSADLVEVEAHVSAPASAVDADDQPPMPLGC